MKRILISAFACDPTKGSESLNGWNWAVELAGKGFEVHCLTRYVNKENINKRKIPANLIFHFIRLPFKLEFLYTFSKPTMYLYYVFWQFLAYKKGAFLLNRYQFVISHHLSWGSIQMGSFLYKLNIPFVFGPAGGGQIAPKNFSEYFGAHWKTELKREKISKWLLNYNPGCKTMLKKSFAVLVSNEDTYNMVKKIRDTQIYFILDAALPKSFYPSKKIIKNYEKAELKLLWVGRFLSRKGILLVVDVMRELKHIPEITLTVVGDGEMRDEFLERIEKYELKEKIFWEGVVSHQEVRNYYADNDIFFFTSLRDSCPAQLIEAFSFSLPVITLDLHGKQ